MSEENIFELASRQQLRFRTAQGEMTTEHLWSLPLTSARGVSLDGIAIGVSRAIKEIGEESFVEAKPNPQLKSLTLQLAILRYVIAVKQAENAAAAQAQLRKGQIQQIEEALASKREDALKSMTPEQLEARLKELRS